jgi:hypothetical protein
LQLQLPDGSRKQLTDDEAVVLCEALWGLTEVRGSLALLGKISHEGKRPHSVQLPIAIDDLEAVVLKRALEQLQEQKFH